MRIYHMIYHMVPTVVWQQQAANAHYVADSLTTEGFIHCTAEPEWLQRVANFAYRTDVRDHSILHIDVDRLDVEVRWEAADGHQFPHVYGPINRNAIVNITDFPRREDGYFLEPLS